MPTMQQRLLDYLEIDEAGWLYDPKTFFCWETSECPARYADWCALSELPVTFSCDECEISDTVCDENCPPEGCRSFMECSHSSEEGKPCGLLLAYFAFLLRHHKVKVFEAEDLTTGDCLDE